MSTKVDQDTANSLFTKTGILVFLDAPQKMEFGIDMNTWEIGPLFKGVKLISPGIHFIHYSTTNQEGNSGMRLGFFHDFKEGEIIIKKWNREQEQLCPGSGLNEYQEEEIRKNIRHFDPNLGAYQLDSSADSTQSRWSSLISHVTKNTLNRVLPSGLSISSATESVYDIEELEKAKLKEQKEKSLASDEGKDAESNLKEISKNISRLDISDLGEDAFKFLLINLKRSFASGASASEITRYSQDKSWLLKNIINRQYSKDPKELLAEFQLSFVVLLIGQNFSAFEHWKRIVHLLTFCVEALGDETLQDKLFVPFLAIVYSQLSECPQDFFTNILSQNNFIAVSMERLVLSLAEYQNSESVKKILLAIDKMRRFLKARFGWKLISYSEAKRSLYIEEGEDAPVIVEM